MSRILLRRVVGGVLLFLALSLSPAVAAAGFLAAAFVTARVPVLVLAGLLCGALTGGLLGWAAFALFGLRRRPALRASAFLAVGLTAAVAVLAAVTVLRPMPTATAAPIPAGVRFWDLPTGSRIAYVHAAAVGKPRPTPVIFLHGGPGTPGEGIPTGGRELAADGFDVYAYDQVGAGRSSRLGDVSGYTVARQVADLEAIRRMLGAERVVLVGQSWGGSLTAQYLAAHGEHVAKAVFTSPGALWGREYPGSEAGEPWNRLSPAQKARLDRLNGEPRILAASLLLPVNPGAAHALVGDREADRWMHEVALQGKDSASCAGASPATPHDNPQGFYVNQLTVRDFERLPDPRPRLRTLRVPSLVMRGECDFIKPAVTAEYERTLPDCELMTVAGAGHAISRDQPRRYTSLLRAFLLDRPLPTGTG
ncbi:alpha/beta fold hydrolase [Streptomyces acidiscabies]|uniref:Alpha/beta fold hydrolase n=1 Tax=Streptomyces acidiscabies TaxID=42234 RepID=A0AAP6ELE6_9ACTN|nr:alpha/beta fold hydrolase [Streptomyces acidiscabies]MBZ3918103.1 alpha/beta fold hydrolase [Streptomyces acidiscabies]MDX2966546.1 alpha/beta fold hydrolase [Streptomyces acidiscabies]MDX3021962.1 alpha/beta fold hydrolase [Streptomyces acidiscabies]MDX3789619.1 alpha/beta fold hydrolase [Streptomyces acidiscabies]